MKKPGTIYAAIYMIWASLLLGIVNFFLYPSVKPAHEVPHHVAVVVGLTVIFLRLLSTSSFCPRSPPTQAGRGWYI